MTIIFCLIASSCDFNVNNSPGPQMSGTVKEAKKHGTFLCAYRVKGNILNGVKIETIFAERQFWRADDLFLKKEIDCCKSQVEISSLSDFFTDSTGFGYEWYIKGFDAPGNNFIRANYNGTLFPDTLKVELVTKNTNRNTTIFFIKVRN